MPFGIDPEEMSENDLRAALADANDNDAIEIWRQLGKLAWGRREFGHVTAISQTVYELCTKVGDVTGAAREKYTQGSGYFNNKEFTEAKDSYMTAADLASQEGVQGLLSDALWAAADCSFSLYDYEDANRLSCESEKIAVADEDTAMAAKASFLQVRALYYLDEEEKALEMRIKARDFYRQVGDIEQVSRVDDFAVTILMYVGRYEEATEIARDVLLKWKVNGDKEWIAYSNYRLGVCLQKEEKFEESNEYLEFARTGYLEVAKVSKVADCEQEIGQNLFNLDLYEPAIQRLLNARSLWDGVGNDWQAMRCDATRAVAYHMQEKYSDAYKLNMKLLDFLELVDDDSYKEMGYLVRNRAADNALASDDFTRVLEVIHEAAEFGDFVPPTHLIIWERTLRARALYALGREDEALLSANAAMELTDDGLLNWNSGYIYEVRGNVLLHKNRKEGEKDLAHAIALHLANGFTDKAIELSKFFIPKIESTKTDVSIDTSFGSSESMMPTNDASRVASQSSAENRVETGETYTGEAYCVKCKEKRPCEGPITINSSGKRLGWGVCPVCGTKMNRILPSREWGAEN